MVVADCRKSGRDLSANQPKIRKNINRLPFIKVFPCYNSNIEILR